MSDDTSIAELEKAVQTLREALEFARQVDLVDEKDLAESYRPNVMRTRHAI
jgi:hypothetical protein